MKKLFFVLTVLVFIAACGEEGMRITSPESEEKPDESQSDTDSDTDTPDTAPDEGDTAQDDTDTNPVPDEGDTAQDDTDSTPDEGDTAQDDTDSTPDDADSTPDNDTDTDTSEGPDDDGTCEIGSTKAEKCVGLPQNAEWNTANYVKQTCGEDGFAPSNSGTYNTEAASSTFENTTPSAKEPLPPDCPEGTTDADGLCEYTGCGQYAYVMYFTTKNGTLVYKQDPASTCFKEASSSGEQVPCCCGKPIYKFSKSGDIQATYDPEVNPMEYAASFNENGSVASTAEWVCKPTIPCDEGYEYGKETGKCYNCSGELSFDGSQYLCLIEIGTECRFKCKTAFKWNGESCI